ncbi:NADH-quinone oxidoreductase subunit C [Streptomyces sp. NPDC050147]|uniref:NADH-quinone oxidoreductase subunit C n=1 Tax=Streptomyces sp. NPDC050147 TaxID=3155513 RepID=UPI00343ED2CF
MTGWLPSPVEDLFGAEATAEESYDLLTVDVPPTSWIAALETARTTLSCTYFDWLSAVDEPGTGPGAAPGSGPGSGPGKGFHVSAHVVALSPVRRLLVRTTVPHDAPVLPTAIDVYAGAAWHERETHEMFGVVFEGHPHLVPLLLPDTFEGHPLRKDFVLAARVAKAWPGAKEPGESEHGGPKRRQMLPPGVPDPNEWGPLKGQLPAAPARPARGAARAAGDRPARRTRTVGEGSASQAAGGPAAADQAAADQAAGAQPEAPAPTPRRARSVSQGSASQRTAGDTPPEPKPDTPPVAKPEASSEPKPEVTPESKPEVTPESKPEAPAPKAKPEAPAAGSDAPWHQARPAFEPAEEPASGAPETPGVAETPETVETPEPPGTPETPETSANTDNGTAETGDDRPGGSE